MESSNKSISSPVEEPVEYDDIQKRNLKNTIVAIEELDDSIIGTIRDLVLVRNELKVPISESDLISLEDIRTTTYLSTNYSVRAIFEFLQTLPQRRKTWLTATRSLSKAYTTDDARGSFDWRFRIREIENAGNKAWKEVVPAAQILATFNGQIVNQIIDHFRVFDDFLDMVHVENGVAQERERFSDELKDTLEAIIYLTRTNGPYMPITMDNINPVKRRLRQIRQSEKLAASNHQQIEAENSEQASGGETQPSRDAAEKIEIGNTPSLIVIISIFTLLTSAFGSVAWKYSPHTPGTKKDADFWFLIQSCTMSILGLATIIFPLIGNTSLQKQTRTTIWCLVALSLGCVVTSIPMYLYLPTEWSAEVAFVGGALQSVVILVMVSDKGLV